MQTAVHPVPRVWPDTWCYTPIRSLGQGVVTPSITRLLGDSYSTGPDMRPGGSNIDPLPTENRGTVSPALQGSPRIRQGPQACLLAG